MVNDEIISCLQVRIILCNVWLLNKFFLLNRIFITDLQKFITSSFYTLEKIKLAIFASGTGSNARKIMDYFAGSERVLVSLLVCNKPGVAVIEIAKERSIPVLLIEKEKFFSGDGYLPELQDAGISFIVLAGFLWKIPLKIIQAYPERIVNIHPALLPKYGGKGMYGARVHEAVIQAKDAESGITIHMVDELYDHGSVIFQAWCPVYPEDTADTLAGRIHELEHEHYAKVIEQTLFEQTNPA